MRLNTRMLLEALEKTEEVVVLGPERPELNLHFPCFYDGREDRLTEGGVYLASRDRLPELEAPVLWVTWGGDPRELPRKGSILYFPREMDPVEVLNRIHGVFLDFQVLEDRTDQILREDNSVMRLLEVSEGWISHPLCAVDASLNYIGYSASFLAMGGGTFFPDPEAGEKGIPSPALFCEPQRDRIASLGKQNLGTLYMLENGSPFTYTEEVLFRRLTEKINQALDNLTVLSGLYQNAFKQQMIRCFETRQVEEEKLYDALVQWGGERGDLFECYKVKASHLNQKVNAEYICSIFENVLYSTVAFWHNGVLVVLVDISRSGCTQEKIHEKMAALVRQLHCKAGVSPAFTDLDRAWNHFRQACCAFEEGYPVAADCDLYFFRDYMERYILHHALGEFSVSDLMDPGLQALQDHDRQYAVSYVETLQTFFRCAMNMSRTAEALGIHRTSLNSRMQKIVSILDHDLDSDYLLYLQIILTILAKPSE